jgi:hypothetical protein
VHLHLSKLFLNLVMVPKRDKTSKKRVAKITWNGFDSLIIQGCSMAIPPR